MNQEQLITNTFCEKYKFRHVKFNAYYVLYIEEELDLKYHGRVNQMSIFKKYLTLKNARIAQKYYEKRDLYLKIIRVLENLEVFK